MTPEECRAMALWMQSAPQDRKATINDGLVARKVDPWHLLSPEERSDALATYRQRHRQRDGREAPAADEIASVSLSRGMCEGVCPVYRVTLSSDGHVEYDGEAFVERIGLHEGEVDPDRVRELIRVILRLGFAELEPEYPTLVSCQPSTELVLAGESWRRGTIDHGGAPLEFWAMAAVIDEVVQQVDWDGLT